MTSSKTSLSTPLACLSRGNRVTGSRDTPQNIHRAENGTSQRLREPSARGGKVGASSIGGGGGGGARASLDLHHIALRADLRGKESSHRPLFLRCHDELRPTRERTLPKSGENDAAMGRER